MLEFNLQMCNQINGLIKNYICSGIVFGNMAKMRWNSLILFLKQSNFNILGLQAQTEVLFAKLIIKSVKDTKIHKNKG
jgi:hypothetical protein